MPSFGRAAVWMGHQCCYIDLFAKESDESYSVRFVPPGGVSEYTKDIQPLVKMDLYCFDFGEAMKSMRLDDSDDSVFRKDFHKGTKSVFGKLNRNQFSRVARIIESGYRYYFQDHPETKPESPYHKWTYGELYNYAKCCVDAIVSNPQKPVSSENHFPPNLKLHIPFNIRQGFPRALSATHFMDPGL